MGYFMFSLEYRLVNNVYDVEIKRNLEPMMNLRLLYSHTFKCSYKNEYLTSNLS